MAALSAIYLGLDCGGSSSRAVARNEEGEIVFQGQSGSANLASTPSFRLRQNLSQAVRGAPRPDYVCGCFAGLLTEEDRTRAIQLIGDIFPHAKVRAEPDYTAAFWACEPETDVCVIAGTGSLVCSWDGRKMVKSGGRGYLLGDFGSAYSYGRDAMLHWLADRENASPPLKKHVEHQFGSLEEPLVISRLYRAPSPQAMLAKLAKPLIVDAKFGAAYANESLDKNSGLLASVVAEHLSSHIHKEEVQICLAGGLWKMSSMFIDAFADHLRRATSKSVTLERIKNPPVYGAVRLAQDMAS